MITRRELLGGALASAAFGKSERPNVLFLAVDDMNDWVGCLGGYSGVRTPNIDVLAWRPNLPGVVSLPGYFKQNGYHAAGVGKIFHHVAGFNSPGKGTSSSSRYSTIHGIA